MSGTRAPSRRVRKIWMGMNPTKCELCSNPLLKFFIDGAMRSVGTWAIMCSSCHAVQGQGIGTGLGQKYEYQKTSKEWIKVEG